jgi:N-methylhydantoinase A
MAWLGIDTGGTFTDFVWYSRDRPEPRVVKVPSDWSDPRSVLSEGLRRLSQEVSAADRVVLGTTLATNTVLEGDGARVGTVTTRGYRDIVEIGRQSRFEMYNLKTLRREPLSRRRWRHELDERTEWDGTVTNVPTADAIESLAETLAEDGVEAVAVCFLFSYVNEENERLVTEQLAARRDWYVTPSHAIARQSKEYERFATTLLNAFVGPRVDRFVTEFEGYLEESSVDARKAFLIAGNGGAMTTEAARSSPVRMINSGPAGGVQAAVEVARVMGVKDVITCDMGGTSTDVCLIPDLDPAVTSEGFLDRVPFIVPHLDLVTIGTGGGSIAWVDIGGELEVGPRSAGAVPGPACYGRGGTEPTVTDANAVLGRLAEEHPLGGTLQLRRELAQEAVSTLLPSFDGMSLEELADGIVRVAVARMATALREVSVARGLDPRDFALVAFGGAGPMHASELARELEIGQVIVPPIPGNFSALGLVMSDVRHDLVQSHPVRLDQLDVASYEQLFAELEDSARARLVDEGFADERISMSRSADMRFAGQWFDLNLPVPGAPDSMDGIERLFRGAHLARYQVDMDRPVEFVNFRVSARGLVDKPDLAAARSGEGDSGPRSWRTVYIDGEFRELPVFDRSALTAAAPITGPAVIEEFGSTTVIASGFTCSAGDVGALVLTAEAEAGAA